MDQRIADYISANRHRYTREAIRQQLIDAGFEPADIDATWAVLDTPDPDSPPDTKFWGRFWLILIGVNLVVLLGVALATGIIANPQQYGLLGILGVALAIGALISWGLVGATGPDKMSRTASTIIGVAIPLVVALFIGGSCYALVGAVGPPPRTGTVTLDVQPAAVSGSGRATCYVDQASGGFSLYGELTDQPVNVSLDTFHPSRGPTDEVQNISVFVQPGNETEPGQSWSAYAGVGTLQSDVANGGLSGTVMFTDLASDMSGPEFEGPSADPISGSVTWSCE